MNFPEAMFYENYLTSDFHTNTVISSLFAYSSKTVIRPIEPITIKSVLSILCKQRNPNIQEKIQKKKQQIFKLKQNMKGCTILPNLFNLRCRTHSIIFDYYYLIIGN